MPDIISRVDFEEDITDLKIYMQQINWKLDELIKKLSDMRLKDMNDNNPINHYLNDLKFKIMGIKAILPSYIKFVDNLNNSGLEFINWLEELRCLKKKE